MTNHNQFTVSDSAQFIMIKFKWTRHIIIVAATLLVSYMIYVFTVEHSWDVTAWATSSIVCVASIVFLAWMLDFFAQIAVPLMRWSAARDAAKVADDLIKEFGIKPISKAAWLEAVSKLSTSGEDEFKAEVNSPELMWERVISPLIKSEPADRSDAEDFLFSKRISNHPRIETSNGDNSYEVADLMSDFANHYMAMLKL